MKRIFAFLFVISSVTCWVACEKTEEATSNTEETSATAEGSTSSESDVPLTTIQFEEENHTFGKIIEGNIAEHVFKFKNSGDNPLIIKNVKASCGCTTPDWSKDPVAPGGEGYIKVSFDSNGKVGTQNKSVTVELNTAEKVRTLSFTGEVVPKK